MADVQFDLQRPRTVHVVGAGGAGMSAIALVLCQMGHRITGSDLRASANLERISLAGVTTTVGHDPDSVPEDADVVVVSSAVAPDNPEVLRAENLGIPVMRRAELLAAITAVKRSIAVAGTHGKTTTASMLTLVLRAGGLRPCFVVGGELNEVGTNAAWDEGEWLVVEADESDGTFLELDAAAALVTSIEADHLDHYGGLDQLVGSFEAFVDGVKGPVALSRDDPLAAALAERSESCVTYGEHSDSTYRIEGLHLGRVGSSFTLVHGTDALGEIALPVPGRHNALNAVGAAAIAAEIGVDFETVRQALVGFGGVARRFQFRGERHGVTFVDDYAHLPTEVRAAVSTAIDGDWRRVIVVFQPHRYSRTEALWSEFADSFVGADHLVITDVYAAGERPRPGVSGRLIHDAVMAADPTMEIEYASGRDELLELPARIGRPGDLFLTLGAGDLTTLPDEWLRDSA